ncbi:MAG: sugar transporter [Gemmatimonadaceae bacterium]|nr:sugar transporter [Chitinophagaceae bacterium]
MKKIYSILALVFAFSAIHAQSEKMVQWNFTTKKVADKTYEIHMTATIAPDYHMYAQDPGVEGPLPTIFKFTANPLATADGKIKEEGKIVKKKEGMWKGSVQYYENSVNFVQKVKLRGNVKTNVAGSVEFMVCNEVRCLPPSEIAFKVNIGG